MELRYPVIGLVGLAAIMAWRIGAVREAPSAADVPEDAAPQAAIHAAPESPDTIRLAPHSLQVAAAARQLLARPDYSYRDDCSGWVSSVFSRAGIPMDGTVAELYEIARSRGLLHHHPIPRIGDLAFFDNTHDRNDNGRWDDERTHVAVVIDVEPDGTAILAHRGSSHRTLPMNLLHPMDRRDADGREINGHLRRTSRDDTWTLYLASQLWTAFATVDPERTWFGRSATHR